MSSAAPLLHLLLTRPELLTEHLGAYAALAVEEGRAGLAPLQRRWRLRLLAWVAWTLAALLTGQAALMLMLLPSPPGPPGPASASAWLWPLVPLLPLLLGTGAALAARRAGPSAPPFAALRQQLALDLLLLQAAAAQPAPAPPAA